MRVLVVNCGSSSVKLSVLDGSGSSAENVVVASRMVERIGGESRLVTDGRATPVEAPDHHAAVRVGLEGLAGPARGSGAPGDPAAGIDAVGHRIVHGGGRFTQPVVLTREVLAAIESVSVLAPLHNPPAVSGIRAAMELLPGGIPQVAVFDTGFYQTLPLRATQYALPRDLAEKHGIRRYGFHGIAHQYAVRRYCSLTNLGETSATLVSFHLGNGCSATAVKDGQAVDTSMGFTPLEGLVMGTRSGDIDPAVVGYVARHEQIAPDRVEALLNEQSGLLGVSGISSDVRDLEAARRQGDERAGEALDLFCYRAQKYLGAYLAVLGGAQAVVFGGGIGEHAPAVRAAICRGMEWCGLVLDEVRNDQTVGQEGRISSDSSPMAAYVVHSDEASLIAEETVRCLTATPTRL